MSIDELYGAMDWRIKTESSGWRFGIVRINHVHWPCYSRDGKPGKLNFGLLCDRKDDGVSGEFA